MDYSNLKLMREFDEKSLPDLDSAVLGALELFASEGVPQFPEIPFSFPLVVGSGNALSAGKIIFQDRPAIFADESSFENALSAYAQIDGAVLISASGGKSSVKISKEMQSKGIKTILLTNNPEPAAGAYLEKGNIFVFPKNREPYTYNTSTYLGMILSKTKESPEKIIESIKSLANAPLVGFGKFDSFFFILPENLYLAGEMFATKFEELFGPKISFRAHTLEGAKHAKTVVPSENELFVDFGKEPAPFGEDSRRLRLPLKKDARYGAIISVGYFLIGLVQRAHPPYFKENLAEYVKSASENFGEKIEAIVE